MKGKVLKQIKNCKITEVKEAQGSLFFVYSPQGDLVFVSSTYVDAGYWIMNNLAYMSNPVEYARIKQAAEVHFAKYIQKEVKPKEDKAPKYVYMVTVKKESVYDEYDNGVEIAGVFLNGDSAYKAKEMVEKWLKYEGYDEGEVMVNEYEINRLEFYDLDKKIN